MNETNKWDYQNAYTYLAAENGKWEKNKDNIKRREKKKWNLCQATKFK